MPPNPSALLHNGSPERIHKSQPVQPKKNRGTITKKDRIEEEYKLDFSGALNQI